MKLPIRIRAVGVSFDMIIEALRLPKDCNVRFIRQEGPFAVTLVLESAEFEPVTENQETPRYHPTFKLLESGKVEFVEWGEPVKPL